VIYLDHGATDAMRPEALEAMTPWLLQPSNPASVHRAGQRARAALESARHDIAAFLGRSAEGIVFTSGATEANATWWHAQRALGRRLVALSAVEHPNSRLAAEEAGVEQVVLPVGLDGRSSLPEPGSVDALSLMVANHETGVLQPVSEALRLGLPTHLDATQAVGRVPLQLGDAEAVVFAGHKLGGPPGVGVLSLQDGEAFPALLPGTQERGRRGGTVNVAGAVGLAAACRAAAAELPAEHARHLALRGPLEEGLRALGAQIVGAGAGRVPHTTCAVFPGIPGELLVQSLDLRGIAVSSGAACASGSTEPSAVLTAMGHPHPGASLRISRGRGTTVDELQSLLQVLRDVVPALRDLEEP